ncbi:Xaa-Pro peptidase family protein [Rhodobacteraceae bacterium D3-12]|nr:Xaa-Pro peptidase family protein [Rhodobacteraceae bacterium D3-12]
MKFDPIATDPTEEEFAGRIAKVQAEMAKQGLDWYVAYEPKNVYYLTNFANFVHERPFILMIPASGKMVFLSPLLEIPHIKNRGVGDMELVSYFEFPAPEGTNWFDKMQEVLSGAKRVGVESVCQLQIYEAIKAERVRSDIIDDIRMIKTPYEVGRMVHAGGIANAAMADLLAQAKPGRTLAEVSSAGNALMFSKLLADFPNINPQANHLTAVFHPASYSHDPHNFGDLSMAMAEGGPHVSIINAVMNGYGTEIERTFFLGHVPEAAKRPYEVMMEGRYIVFDMVKPGVRMSDVDKAVNDHFKAAGYGDNLLHRAGHGMGVTAHEAPFLAEGDTRVLQPGMSFTVEPGIYLEGVEASVTPTRSS